MTVDPHACGRGPFHQVFVAGGKSQMKMPPSVPTETMAVLSGRIATLLMHPLCPLPSA